MGATWVVVVEVMVMLTPLRARHNSKGGKACSRPLNCRLHVQREREKSQRIEQAKHGPERRARP